MELKGVSEVQLEGLSRYLMLTDPKVTDFEQYQPFRILRIEEFDAYLEACWTILLFGKCVKIECMHECSELMEKRK